MVWWNPRTWHKHAKSDVSDVIETELHPSKDAPEADAARTSRERERQYNRAFIEKHTRDIARSRGEVAPDNDDDLELALSYGKERAPPGYNAPSGYRAPPTMATGQIMTDTEKAPGFLSLPFDWFIVNNWRKIDLLEESFERRQEHLRLGVSYAALGHEGRRPYVQKAFEWRVGSPDPDVSTPSNVSGVPKDLLSPIERRLCDPDHSPSPIWIRTYYGPGTDGRFQELLQECPDSSIRMEIVQDAQRYNIPHGDLRSIFAFLPALMEAQHIHYLEDAYAFESDEIQNALLAAHLVDSLPEEDRRAHSLPHFFIADAEAMRSGFIRWVVADQYGTLLFSERIKPWSLVQALSLRSKRTLQEFRDEIARGWYEDDSKYSDHIVAS
ncbi:hypothetical protein MBLNU13_g04156t1 [Cladosporium sp. NU13]